MSLLSKVPHSVRLLRLFLVTRFLSIGGTIVWMVSVSMSDGPLVATEGSALAVNLGIITANVALIVLTLRKSRLLVPCGFLYMATTLAYDLWRIPRALAVQSRSAPIYAVSAAWCLFWLWYFATRRFDDGTSLSRAE